MTYNVFGGTLSLTQSINLLIHRAAANVGIHVIYVGTVPHHTASHK